MKAGHPSNLMVHFETELSHARTAFLWDLGLNMQPHLTSSALLSMAASVAALLASDAHSTTAPLPLAHTALLNTVAEAPKRLPSRSQMSQNPGCSIVQLSVEVATGHFSISYNGIPRMKSVMSQAAAQGFRARAELGTPAGDSLGALGHMLQPLVGAAPPRRPTSALVWAQSAGQADSDYTLHPAVIELPVSLRALTAESAKSQPTWLQSAAAIAVSAASISATHVALDSSCSISAWSTNSQVVNWQEGSSFTSGLAYTEASTSEAAAATAAAKLSVLDDNEAVKEANGSVVPADSTLLHMDSLERKLYIQAQVSLHHQLYEIL